MCDPLVNRSHTNVYDSRCKSDRTVKHKSHWNDALMNRSHTNVLAKKDECCMFIHDSRCKSDRKVKHKSHWNDALMNQ